MDSGADGTGGGHKAGRREWLGLAVIAIPCMLYSMDLTVLNLAAPRLSTDLRPTGIQFLWMMDIYGFLIAASLITMGTLGDRIGRRKLLFIGAALFGLVSLLAAFSRSAETFIFSRALLGVAAATLAPSTLSLIRNMFVDDKERTTAIGIWVASFSMGAAVGPLVGGLLLTHFWWGSVFLINVPMMLVLLSVGPFLLPEFRDPQARRLDLISAGLSLIAVLLMIYGMKHAAATGDRLDSILFMVGGLILGWIFVRRQLHLAYPLIELRLFRSLSFSMALLVGILAFFVNFGALFFVAQYLQLGLGLTPLEAGLWTMPSAMGFILSSVVSPGIARRFQPSVVVSGGFVLTTFGLAVIAIFAVQGFIAIIAGSVILSIGLAPVVILSTDLVVGAAPPERAGSASALSETSAELGGALGIAVLGSVITAVYRAKMANVGLVDLSPYSVAGVRDSLSEAIVLAQQLPADLARILVESAREAFVQGIQLSAGIAGAVALTAAIIAATLLSRSSSGSATQDDPQ
jgi:DHA2 family multidrug resistance protein-like MFS transporter